MKEEDAKSIFGPYLQGLALLGKSDAFLSLDLHTLHAFHAALEKALILYGDWDGKPENLIPTLHRLFAEIIPEEMNREVIFRYLKESPKTAQEFQEQAISSKRVVDLYLTQIAYRLWRSRAL